ncbi:MAG TPA: efflux RND transporter periplasmic adaptor subunit [Candidatus Binataceae bacterium]|nr:efflux RND transporter periplasmic adaptor subunit [Candidatus Binataceae bacterium]
MAGEQSRPPNLRELESLRIKRGAEPRRPSRVIPAAIVLGVLAIFGAGGYYAYTKTLGRPPEVQTAIVSIKQAGQPGTVLTGSGYVVTRDKYITIGAQILGQIVAEPIQEGQRVKKGDLLAKIDDRDYVAQLDQAIADRSLAAANLELARAQEARQRELYKNHIESKDQYEIAANAVAADQAYLQKAEAAIEFAKFNVSQCTIRSPINGIVLTKYREVGSMINYGNAISSGEGTADIAQLADTDDMRAEVDINESDIAKVTIGSPARVTLDAYPDHPFDSSVVKIYPAADRQKGTVKVEVHILQPDLDIIKPEMSAKVTFLAAAPVRQEAALVLVPKKAVISDGSHSYVWAVRDATAYRTQITLGREFQDGLQVTGGLSGGETVIVAPPAGLRDGQRITPVAS